VIPPEGGLLRGIFRIERIAGDWGKDVSINVDGQAIFGFSRADDAVLFVLPGLLTRPAHVEVRGEMKASPARRLASEEEDPASNDANERE
jgi:hypothetical protein